MITWTKACRNRCVYAHERWTKSLIL